MVWSTMETLGVPKDITQAMMHRDRELEQQAAQQLDQQRRIDASMAAANAVGAAQSPGQPFSNAINGSLHHGDWGFGLSAL